MNAETQTTTTAICPGLPMNTDRVCVDLPDFVADVDGPVDIDFDGEPEVVSIPVQETRAFCPRVPFLGGCRR